jgi:hypothetical protein
MTKSSSTSACPGEAPYQVQTTAGIAVISLVAAIMNIQPTDPEHGKQCDRLVLRSTVEGLPDMYAVFERRHGSAESWWKVTDDLSLGELDDWPARRRHRVSPSTPFQRWLDRIRTD